MSPKVTKRSPVDTRIAREVDVDVEAREKAKASESEARSVEATKRVVDTIAHVGEIKVQPIEQRAEAKSASPSALSAGIARTASAPSPPLTLSFASGTKQERLNVLQERGFEVDTSGSSLLNDGWQAAASGKTVFGDAAAAIRGGDGFLAITDAPGGQKQFARFDNNGWPIF
jgi:hypothetical protein